MKNYRFILILSFLLVAAITYSQNSNPFDLNFRKPAKTEVAEKREIKSEKSDPAAQQERTSAIEDTSGKPVLQRNLPLIKGNPFDITGPTGKRAQPDYEVRPEVPKSSVKDEDTRSVNSVLFWILLITVLLLAVFINLNRSLPGQFYKAIFNENYLKYLQRSYTSDARLLYAFFYFFFVLNGGIFLFLIIRHFTGISDLGTLFYCWAGVLLLYIFRHQFIRYIKYVYPLEKSFGVLNFSIMVYNAFLGMILLPVNIILVFSPEWFMLLFLYLGIATVVGLYLIRELRAMMNSLSEITTHPVHFFLYLCACEIMPILILGKFLQQAV